MNKSTYSPTASQNNSKSVVHKKNILLQTVINCFNNTFFTQYNTRLIAGDTEPYYLPAGMGEALERKAYHQIIFANSFIASALHEVAHWCVAGDKRRELPDYGYWYCPDGRSTAEQKKFEQVEVKPQAIEWVFSKALQQRFRVSKDNIESASGLIEDKRFEQAVLQQVHFYCNNNLPPRAERFRQVLEGLSGASIEYSLLTTSYDLTEIL